MPRFQLNPPDRIVFTTSLDFGVTDLNYRGHMARTGALFADLEISAVVQVPQAIRTLMEMNKL